MVMLIFGSFSKDLGAFGTFTLEKYIRSYTDPDFASIIFNTAIFTIGSAHSLLDHRPGHVVL